MARTREEEQQEDVEMAEEAEDSSASSSSDSEPARASVKHAPSSSSESESEQEEQQEQEQEQVEESEDEAEEMEVDAEGEEEEEKEEQANSSSDSEEEEATPVVQEQTQSSDRSDSEEEADENVAQTQEESSDSSDSEEEEETEEAKPVAQQQEESSDSSESEGEVDQETTPVVLQQQQQQQEESSDSSDSEDEAEKETPPAVQSKDESSESEDSEEEEEENATPVVQKHEESSGSSDSEDEVEQKTEPVVLNKQESSDSSDSEDEVETKPAALVKQETSDSSDSGGEGEVEQDTTPVVQSKQESPDSSDSESEVEQEVVETKQVSSDSSDSEDEVEQKATSVVQSKQESFDSSDSENEKEEEQEQLKRQPTEKRKAVKVLVPVEEGPPNKKAKLETVESTEEDTRKKTVRRMLWPLSKDQLVETVVAAALKYPELYADLTAAADYDPSQPPPRKVAVHGLAPETESIKLRQRFISFGTVEDATIIRDKSSGKSLGFGYVTFAGWMAAHQAVRTPTIKGDGRVVSCSFAKAGDDAKEKPPTNATVAPQQPRERPPTNAAVAPPQPQERPQASNLDAVDRKLFVRFLAKKTGKDTLQKAFEKFGEVEDVQLVWDHATNQSKCYGFVIFREKAGADSALRFTTMKIDGNDVKYNLAAEGKKASTDLAPDRTLMVRALAKKTSNVTLRKAFEKFGDVESAHVVQDRATNESKCYGFVTFREKAGADSALKTPTMKIDGNDVNYSLAAKGKNASAEQAPDRTLHVSSLSNKTTTATLRKEYEKFGAVETAFVLWDRATNRNKGYGFVTYREKAGADNALKSPTMKIDGHDVVHVLACEGKKQRLKEANTRSLMVRHISRSKTTEESLREAFEQFGDVESTHVVRDKQTGESKGVGFVTFREKAAADRALQVPQQSLKLHGKKLLCLPRVAHR